MKRRLGTGGFPARTTNGWRNGLGRECQKGGLAHPWQEMCCSSRLQDRGFGAMLPAPLVVDTRASGFWSC